MERLLEITGKLIEGEFLERPNKFTVVVNIAGEKVACHLSDPGRLIKLLIPRNKILVREKNGDKRKTRYEVIAVFDKESNSWIFLNPAMHTQIIYQILIKKLLKPLEDYEIVKREFPYKSSRIDFLLRSSSGRKALLEVKGCTYIEDSIAYYPDAPTKRGVKHLSDLIEALKEDYEAYVLFLVPRVVQEVRPNWGIDPKFSRKMIEAYEKGVKFLGVSVILKKNILYYAGEIVVNPYIPNSLHY